MKGWPKVLKIGGIIVQATDQLELASVCLKEKAHEICKGMCGYDTKCHCLSIFLNNEEGRMAVAEHIFSWASCLLINSKKSLITRMQNTTSLEQFTGMQTTNYKLPSKIVDDTFENTNFGRVMIWSGRMRTIQWMGPKSWR